MSPNILVLMEMFFFSFFVHLQQIAWAKARAV